MLYNVYCDETCHLEHDGINDMVIGAVWCPQNKLREINQRIKEIKARNGISPSTELKWTKVSPAKVQAYKDVIDYFFDDDDLHFRAIIIPDKSKLNHAAFHQTHDEWYYKMYYLLLSKWIDIEKTYSIYIDIKDSNGGNKIRKLQEIINNFLYGFNCVSKIQLVRSEELLILQLCDLIIGAIGYKNRFLSSHFGQHKISKAKSEVCQLIVEKTGLTLENSTSLYESKFNIFVWSPKEI